MPQHCLFNAFDDLNTFQLAITVCKKIKHVCIRDSERKKLSSFSLAIRLVCYQDLRPSFLQRSFRIKILSLLNINAMLLSWLLCPKKIIGGKDRFSGSVYTIHYTVYVQQGESFVIMSSMTSQSYSRKFIEHKCAVSSLTVYCTERKLRTTNNFRKKCFKLV